MASVAPPQSKNNETTQNKRVDWKKQKELEEARKAGTAPPEVDEEGKYVNWLIEKCKNNYFDFPIWFYFIYFFPWIGEFVLWSM